MEVSALEEAEAELEAKSKWKRRKRKRTRSCSGSDCGEGTSGGNIKHGASRNKKRRLRIVTVESSDSDSNSHAVNKRSTSCVERVQEQIPVLSPKVRTEAINTNSAGILSLGYLDSEFTYKKSIGCRALGQSTVSSKRNVCKPEAVAISDEPTKKNVCSTEAVDVSGESTKKNVCRTEAVDVSDESTEKNVCRTEAVDVSDESTKKNECRTEAVDVRDEWDLSDWNFDNLDLSPAKEVFVEKDHAKLVITCDTNGTRASKCLSSGEMGMVPPVLTCSRKLVSKAVRSLSAEFDKEILPTSLSGDGIARQLAVIDAHNSKFSLPEHSVAGLSQEQKFEVLNTTVLKVSQTCFCYLCVFCLHFSLFVAFMEWDFIGMLGKEAYLKFMSIPTA
jgi:hypothetical protein